MSKFDVVFAAQRMAFAMLNDKDFRAGQNKELKVNPKSITIPATIIQEQALTNTNNRLDFIFGIKSPDGTSILNNVVLGQNDIAVVYGIQLLIGQGPLVNSRVYRSFGPAVQDNAPYNATMEMQLESNIPVTQIDTLQFQKIDGTNRDQLDGLSIINPLRVISGKVSKFNLSLLMQPVNALVFTPSLFVSLRLWIALGQAEM